MDQTLSRPTLDQSIRIARLGTSANRLLAALPDSEMERWAPHLKLVDLSLGQVISEPGSDIAYAYFPLDGIVSLLYVMNEEESAEIALVGNDGMLGVTLFMGGNSTTIRAVVVPIKYSRKRRPAKNLAIRRGGSATPV